MAVTPALPPSSLRSGLEVDALRGTVRRSVLVVDLVESVRLIEEDEEGAVRRWRDLVDWVQQHLLPTRGGRLVKSLGDGLMLEFGDARAAVYAALALNREADRRNAVVRVQQRQQLRMGMHAAQVIADALDIYGHGVNLAARLCSLAGPGELVVSSAVRDELTDGIDATVVDIGECYLKNVSKPVHAFRVTAPDAAAVVTYGSSGRAELRPTLAVIPFTARVAGGDERVVGDILADEVIAGLSRCEELNVVSRLSTAAFRNRQVSVAELRRFLKADYVMSGTYAIDGDRAMLSVELTDTLDGRAIWAGRMRGSVLGITWGEDPIFDELVARTSALVLGSEMERIRSHALPTLQAHTLLVAGIGMMHRLTRADFDRARELLAAAAERAPNNAAPHAWLAQWHVFRIYQNWSVDVDDDRRTARALVQRALDAEPNSSFALTIRGLVQVICDSDTDGARSSYLAALDCNPNNSLAWLQNGALSAFRGEGERAVEQTGQALRLSPLDPRRWYYDSLSATAAIAAGRYDQAIEAAKQSLRANRTHLSTWRALVLAQSLGGRLEDARRDAQELLKLSPGMTVSGWLAHSPTARFPVGRQLADAMLAAGIPES